MEDGSLGTGAGLSPRRPGSINDRDRPRCHFLPPRHWMNDPNGLIQWRGRHPLLYQLPAQSQRRLLGYHALGARRRRRPGPLARSTDRADVDPRLPRRGRLLLRLRRRQRRRPDDRPHRGPRAGSAALRRHGERRPRRLGEVSRQPRDLRAAARPRSGGLSRPGCLAGGRHLVPAHRRRYSGRGGHQTALPVGRPPRLGVPAPVQLPATAAWSSRSGWSRCGSARAWCRWGQAPANRLGLRRHRSPQHALPGLLSRDLRRPQADCGSPGHGRPRRPRLRSAADAGRPRSVPDVRVDLGGGEDGRGGTRRGRRNVAAAPA